MTDTREDAESILVSFDLGLYGTYFPGMSVPAGWRITQLSQWALIKDGYRYAPHWEVGGRRSMMEASDGQDPILGR